MKLFPKITNPKRTALISCLLAGFVYTSSTFIAICCFMMISITFTSIIISNARELRLEASLKQNPLFLTKAQSAIAPNLVSAKAFLPSSSNVPALNETVKSPEAVTQLPKLK